MSATQPTPSVSPAQPSGVDAPPAAGPFWPFLFALAAVAGLAELALVIVNVSALPVYLEYGLNLGHLVGFALGSFYLAEALGNLPMGTLGDRLGRRRLMVIGALISVGTCVGTALIGMEYKHLFHGERPNATFAGLVAGLLLVLRVLDGLGAAALWPTLFASVGDRVPPERQAQAMSILNITYFVGIAFGPFVGGLVNDNFSPELAKGDPVRYAPSFLLAAACFGVAAIIAYFVAPRRNEQHHLDPGPLSDHEREALGEAGAAAAHDPHESTFSLDALRGALRRVPALMALAFLTFLAIGLIAPYIKLFAIERYLRDVPVTDQETVFGQLLLAPSLLVAVLAVPLGHGTDRWGKSRSIIGGMGVCALSLWVMLLIPSRFAVVVLGSLMGIGFVLAFPAYMAYIADVAGPRERGGMIGAVRMTQGIGALVGTLVSGPLFQLDKHHMDRRAPILFIVAGVLLTLGFLLSLFFVREKLTVPPADAPAS